MTIPADNCRKNNTFRHGWFCRYSKTSAATSRMIWIITELWKNWRKSYSKMISNFMFSCYFFIFKIWLVLVVKLMCISTFKSNFFDILFNNLSNH